MAAEYSRSTGMVDSRFPAISRIKSANVLSATIWRRENNAACEVIPYRCTRNPRAWPGRFVEGSYASIWSAAFAATIWSGVGET